MNKIKELLAKYKGILLYGIFGVLTTIINTVVYFLFYDILGVANVPSTMIAWVIAVAFAFVTNKLFVFESKSMSLETLKHEVPSFVGCRILTGILDVAIMYVAVDVMMLNATMMKLASNVLVIILNYAASKLFIFKKK